MLIDKIIKTDFRTKPLNPYGPRNSGGVPFDDSGKLTSRKTLIFSEIKPKVDRRTLYSEYIDGLLKDAASFRERVEALDSKIKRWSGEVSHFSPVLSSLLEVALKSGQVRYVWHPVFGYIPENISLIKLYRKVAENLTASLERAKRGLKSEKPEFPYDAKTLGSLINTRKTLEYQRHSLPGIEKEVNHILAYVLYLESDTKIVIDEKVRKALKLLGLDPTQRPNQDAFKKAKRKQLKRTHPDHNQGDSGANSKTQVLIDAYKLVENFIKRSSGSKSLLDRFLETLPRNEREEILEIISIISV